MRKLGFAVIGAGFWGENHVRVLSQFENVNLLAVCDVDHVRARETAEKYRVDSFMNFERLLKRDDIEAVSICTPTTTHYQIALRVIECGKHVLVEKPMVSNTMEAKSLLVEAERQGVHLTVGFIERYNPGVQRVETLMKNKVLGEAILAFSRRVGRWPERIGDVGVVKDTAIHDFDVLRHIFREEPHSVYAIMGSLNHKFEDYAHVVLGFNDMKTGSVEANWLTPHKIRRLTITCEAGIVTLNYLTQEITIEDHEKVVRPKHEWIEPLRLELKDFVQSLLEDHDPKVTGRDGLRALEIAEAAFESARLNNSVEM